MYIYMWSNIWRGCESSLYPATCQAYTSASASRYANTLSTRDCHKLGKSNLGELLFLCLKRVVHSL
jgi:hypothetical protein